MAYFKSTMPWYWIGKEHIVKNVGAVGVGTCMRKTPEARILI